jgi:hypothetical protein
MCTGNKSLNKKIYPIWVETPGRKGPRTAEAINKRVENKIQEE